MSHWLDYGGSMAMNGYDIWLYDYRGFGASMFFEIDSTALYYPVFEKDLSAVIEHVKKTSTRKIYLLGLSMGSIISTNYMIEYPSMIDFYIGDGHIYSPEKARDRLVKKRKRY